MTTFKREMAMDQADGRGIFIHKGRDKVRCVVFSAEFFAESLEGEAKYGENALKHGKNMGNYVRMNAILVLGGMLPSKTNMFARKIVLGSWKMILSF